MLDTAAISGLIPSTTISLLSAKLFVPRAGSSMFASVTPFLIEPPFRLNALTEVYSKSLVSSPACTVYVKVKVFVPLPEL